MVAQTDAALKWMAVHGPESPSEVSPAETIFVCGALSVSMLNKFGREDHLHACVFWEFAFTELRSC